MYTLNIKDIKENSLCLTKGRASPTYLEFYTAIGFRVLQNITSLENPILCLNKDVALRESLTFWRESLIL